MENILKSVISRLEQKSKTERVKHSETYYPTSLRLLGVKVPDQREIVGWLRNEVKGW